ncbi:neurogenic locus notch homolog protein 2-like, partial [Ceratina calcarata]|uniref:Neurogenic locus notch homolog protein 2-like n=2 Tax=Ceratina calcarata TaxID=156304 RepID=A0AAJ7S3D8_9HYME
LCGSTRDCIGDQLCINGLCQPTCKSNSSCPEYQYCHNNICVQELRCLSDDDCSYDERCVKNNIGQAECRKACDLILCGRNAECKADDHVALCSCKSTFFGNPKDDKIGCQPIECETNDDCSGEKVCDTHKCRIACLAHNPCGVNAICTAERHTQICTCQPGYTGEPTHGCQLIDYCLNEPCAPGAVCENSRGSYKCHCQQGMVGDPYNSGCQPPVECLHDEDCPLTAKCISVNNVPKCSDVCSRTQCGPNADCTAANHAAACQCRSDYEGDPNNLSIGCRPKPVVCSSATDCSTNTYCYEGICRPFCQSNEECNLSDVCLSGQCLDPCSVRAACGMNAECDVRSHIKQCSCPPGFTGNSEVECVRLPVSCRDTTDCNDGNTCRDNVCLPICSSDNECAFNEKCVRGNCLLTCRLDNDCFLGHICLNNMCTFGCRADEDCNANEGCITNKCINPCEATPCGPNAKCTVVNQRATCSCPAGFIPNPTAKVACLRSPGPVCQANRDCTTGTACIRGFCTPVCSTDLNCLSNERCDPTGVCKSLCRRDEDCRSGEICEGLVCVIGCRADVECQENSACLNNQCQ